MSRVNAGQNSLQQLQGQAELPDIFDIEPVGFDPIFWALCIGGALVVSLLAYFILKKLRAHKNQDGTNKIKQVDRLEMLKLKLKNLETKNPFVDKAQRDFYEELTLSYRGMIDYYFSLGTTDKTLQQLRPVMRENFSKDISECSLEIFERADKVKFAGVEVSVDKAQNDHLNILNLCDALSVLNDKMLEQSLVAETNGEETKSD